MPIKRRWIISGIVIGGLFLAVSHGRRVTYIDSSGSYFQQKIGILGLEIPIRIWPVPMIGEPDPAPVLPWVMHSARPHLFMQGTLHYDSGRKIYRMRQQADFDRAMED